ncbi:hypothetical protein ACU4GD_06310 [Cupriavidus basilensis]
MTWAFAPQWQVGGGLRYVGKRYTNTCQYDGHAVVHGGRCLAAMAHIVARRR